MSERVKYIVIVEDRNYESTTVDEVRYNYSESELEQAIKQVDKLLADEESAYIAEVLDMEYPSKRYQWMQAVTEGHTDLGFEAWRADGTGT